MALIRAPLAHGALVLGLWFLLDWAIETSAHTVREDTPTLSAPRMLPITH